VTPPAAAPGARSSRRQTVHPLVFVAATLVMANLGALVDAVLHPETPYLDAEHVIVGAVTGLCGAVIYYGLRRITSGLSAAREELRVLHEVVPICSECKRVRRPDSDPEVQASWEPIEFVVERMAQRKVSHGLCPTCLQRHFPAGTARTA
jgi:hypothetical protein